MGPPTPTGTRSRIGAVELLARVPTACARRFVALVEPTKSAIAEPITTTFSTSMAGRWRRTHHLRFLGIEDPGIEITAFSAVSGGGWRDHSLDAKCGPRRLTAPSRARTSRRPNTFEHCRADLLMPPGTPMAGTNPSRAARGRRPRTHRHTRLDLDTAGARRRRTGRLGTDQQGNRRTPVRLGQNGFHASAPRLPQARHHHPQRPARRHE